MEALPLNSVHYVMLNRAHDLARLGQNLLTSWCNSSETHGDADRNGRGGVDGGKVLHAPSLPLFLTGVYSKLWDLFHGN
jgi:hypothetical protein